MLISFSGKCLGEGSISYSSQSITYVLPTFISWRYWLPETNCPQKPQNELFLQVKAQRAEHGSHQPSCAYHRVQIHAPQHLFSACPHLKANHSLYSSTTGWLDGELSQGLLSLFPSSISWAGSIPCCVCGFCCLLAGFITYATGVERNPLSSLVLGSFAGWHWRYIWTLGTVLLERQVRICQNTTVYTCRKKREVGFYSQSFCCGQLGLVPPRGTREVTEGKLFLVQGDTRFSGHFPACRHLLCITLKRCFLLSCCVCPFLPKEIPWRCHSRDMQPVPGCAQLTLKSWVCSIACCGLKLQRISTDFCSKVFIFH